MFLVLRGLGDGAHQQIAEIGVRMGLGDVVVYAKGYRDDPSLDHLVHDAEKVRATALALGDAVEGVAVRLQADGLTQAGATSVGSSVWGVDPASEGRLSKVGAPASIVERRRARCRRRPAAWRPAAANRDRSRDGARSWARASTIASR